MKPTLTLLALLLFTACKKEEVEALPEATRTGQNTGGCLIDGKAFVAKGWPSGGLLGPRAIPPLTGGFAFDSVYYVELNGQHNGQNASIFLFLRKRVAGIYLLNPNTQYYPQGSPRYILDHATYSTSNNTGEVYVTDARHTGQVQPIIGTPEEVPVPRKVTFISNYELRIINYELVAGIFANC